MLHVIFTNRVKRVVRKLKATDIMAWRQYIRTYLLFSLTSTPEEKSYSPCPKLFVAFGFHATSLTRFVENMCNICISK
jgi:hypothetical protein